MDINNIIDNLLRHLNKKIESTELDFDYYIVGNIVDEHYFGEAKIIKKGTKQFRPGAKVYCIPEFGGMAHENIRVIGKPRKQTRLIDIVMDSKRIKNYRIRKVYSSNIRSKIGSHYYWNNENSIELLKDLDELVIYLNTLTEEI